MGDANRLRKNSRQMECPAMKHKRVGILASSSLLALGLGAISLTLDQHAWLAEASSISERQINQNAGGTLTPINVHARDLAPRPTIPGNEAPWTGVKVTASRVPQATPSAKMPSPVIALIRRSSWTWVFGGEPILVLYEDGRIIYSIGNSRDGRYMVARLTDKQISRMLEKVSLRKLEGFDRSYDSSNGAADLSEYRLLRRRADGTYKDIAIYGGIETARTQDGTEYQPLPPDLASICKYLATFAAENAEEWVPDYIEVIVWRYDYFTEEPLAWPKDWPDLSDSKTKQNGDRYVLLLERSKHKALHALLSSLKDGQGIRISGQAYAVATRSQFPQEEIWTTLRPRK